MPSGKNNSCFCTWFHGFFPLKRELIFESNYCSKIWSHASSKKEAYGNNIISFLGQFFMFLAPRVTKTLVHDAEKLQFALRLSSSSNKIRGREDILWKLIFSSNLSSFIVRYFVICHTTLVHSRRTTAVHIGSLESYKDCQGSCGSQQEGGGPRGHGWGAVTVGGRGHHAQVALDLDVVALHDKHQGSLKVKKLGVFSKLICLTERSYQFFFELQLSLIFMIFLYEVL